jgi:predicted ribosome quality control (RQC) complex YloA/Tae2 family protein
MRLLKIASVVVEQLRAYPDSDIASKLEATEFERVLDLSIENRSRWM